MFLMLVGFMFHCDVMCLCVEGGECVRAYMFLRTIFGALVTLFSLSLCFFFADVLFLFLWYLFCPVLFSFSFCVRVFFLFSSSTWAYVVCDVVYYALAISLSLSLSLFPSVYVCVFSIEIPLLDFFHLNEPNEFYVILFRFALYATFQIFLCAVSEKLRGA